MRENNQLLEWAATAIGRGAQVVEAHPLHADQGPWRLTAVHRGRLTQCVLRAPTPRIDLGMIATSAAALQVAEHHQLPAPRLIALDLDVASLETLVPGTSAWAVGTPESLRASGAALTLLHSVAMSPQEHLPFRPRPIDVDDFAADRRTGRMPTTPLLTQADHLITAHGLPAEDTTFVHGDVWPGNLVWTGDQLAAFIDWKSAGVGAPGVDLSELRKQAAISFGPGAPAEVLAGWEQAAGREAHHVAYWDAVAALNTPTTLYDALATTRRNAFLHQALKNLP